MKIGIRREDKSPWESRVPLIPEHVAELIDVHGIQFHVQPSEQRIYSDEEYAEQGALITEDLSDCPIIMGVKQVPPDLLEPAKTYLFFSHTIKGQPENLPILRRLMQLECNLIDYEVITEPSGKRLVFFGYYAGLAGMIDTLWCLGRRLALEGRDTPLARITPAHQYESVDAAKEHLAEIATEIEMNNGLAGCGPIVCGFSGYGRVSQGAQEILDLFSPSSLAPGVLIDESFSHEDGRFYKTVFHEEHLVSRIDPSQAFNLHEYYDCPERYRSVFEQYLPHLTVLVNCIYWEPKYPRLVTLASLEKLYHGPKSSTLKVIGDISCDVNGSVECNVRATDPGDPVYVYDVDLNEAVSGFEGRGPVVLAVEILPTELPRDASREFSAALKDLIPALAKADPMGSIDQWTLPAPLRSAVIVHQGRLTEPFRYLGGYLH